MTASFYWANKQSDDERAIEYSETLFLVQIIKVFYDRSGFFTWTLLLNLGRLAKTFALLQSAEFH